MIPLRNSAKDGSIWKALAPLGTVQYSLRAKEREVWSTHHLKSNSSLCKQASSHNVAPGNNRLRPESER